MADPPNADQRRDAIAMSGHHPLPPVVVIAGPTAVGKTRLAIDLSRRFGGEVVNADSRYLYRGFSIGLAKPTLDERGDVAHHLIDILDPWEEMSLALFQQRALVAIGSVHSRGLIPFFTGGTPLYVNAVVEGWTIPEVPPNPQFREKMAAEIDSLGIEPAAARLAAVDPVAAGRSARNPRRIIRALEIYEATGTPMTALEGKRPQPFRFLQIGLTMPRERLFAVIDARVDDQIAGGLIEEARALLDAGVDPASPAFSSIGYRQLVPYFAGETTLESAIERIKFDTHRYVRHQETWLRRNRALLRVDVTIPGWEDAAAEMVEQFLSGVTIENAGHDRT
ncbi:MAG: tRNA (adenosine(37)-N6)-dimethylallyltransferase MiaA [Thermomicrobiales bacterium]